MRNKKFYQETVHHAQEDSFMPDATTQYLNDIRRFPLLTPAEEIALAEIIKNGPPKECGIARKDLANSNLRLVVSIAKKYTAKHLELLDLIQAGNEGLMIAVDKFDPSRGNRFSTYASFWIKNAMLRHIFDCDNTVRLPIYVHEQYAAIKKAARILEAKLNRRPTVEEIAKEMGKEVSFIQEIFDNFNNINIISLETPLGTDDKSNETTMKDLLADSFATDPEDAAVESDRKDVVMDIMKDVLNTKEVDILCRRFGLDGVDPQTLSQIAGDYHITRERVRQVQVGALHKLGKSKYAKVLYSLL